MPVCKLPKPQLSPGPLSLAINHNRPNEQMELEVAECLSLAQELIEPQLVYELMAVLERGTDWVEIESNQGGRVRLTIGPNADLLRPAEMVVAGVCTIGPGLEKEVTRLNKEKDAYKAYILDCVGVALLAEVGAALDHLAEEEASRRGWGVGRRMAPGSLNGWDMQDQKKLIGTIPVERIQVSINQSGMLVPFKSAASLIGMGAGFSSHKVGRVCHLCLNRDKCWLRD